MNVICIFAYEILMNDVTTDGDMMNVRYMKYQNDVITDGVGGDPSNSSQPVAHGLQHMAMDIYGSEPWHPGFVQYKRGYIAYCYLMICIPSIHGGHIPGGSSLPLYWLIASCHHLRRFSVQIWNVFLGWTPMVFMVYIYTSFFGRFIPKFACFIPSCS